MLTHTHARTHVRMHAHMSKRTLFHAVSGVQACAAEHTAGAVKSAGGCGKSDSCQRLI